MNQLVTLLLTAALLNVLSWIILIPIWQYPDEQAHFAQIQYMSEMGGKVSDSRTLDTSREVALAEKVLGTERDGFGNNKFTYHPEYKIEYSQNLFGPGEKVISSLPKESRSEMVKNEATENPPLYYFLGSTVYIFFGLGDLFVRVFAIRFLSAIFFLLTVFTSYKIGQVIFKDKIIQIVLAALVAFKPMLVFASTGVLPDTLTNLLFALIVYFSLKILTDGIKFGSLSAIFVLVILGSLTRQHFLISFPIIGLAVCYRLLKDRRALTKFFQPLISLIVGLFLLSYFIPQLKFFSSFVSAEIGRPDLRLLFDVRFIDHTLLTVKQTIAQTLPWYWGVYRWLSLTSPPIYYQIINRLIIVAVAGLIIRAFLIFRSRKFSQLDLIGLFLITSSLLYYLIILIWDYFFTVSSGFSFGIQGRYFFPLAVFHLSILLIGFKQIFELFFEKYAKAGFLLLAISMILFNNLSLWHLSSSYYDTPSINSFVIQASQYKPLIFKGIPIVFIPLLNLLLQIALIIALIANFRKFDVIVRK